MVVHPINQPESLELDDSLVIYLHECPGKHYLLHNPHTFVGRIGVYCSSKNRTANISLSEISETTLESDYWLKGYFAGAEPDPPRDEQGDYLGHDDSWMIQWRAAIREFPKTGLWHSGDRQCKCCGSPLLPTTPGEVCCVCGP